MKLRRSKAALTALLLCSAAGLAGSSIALWPAFGQDSPESLLPPGFGDPVPPAPAPAPGQPRPDGPTDLLPPVALTPPEEGELAPGEEEEAEEEEEIPPEELEMPKAARRSIDAVGPLQEGYGLRPDAWGSANGRFLAGLMRRIDAPIASRWGSILLRRALLSNVPTPAAVAPIDWVSERAWLLLRMGEADAARMLVQSVDVHRFSPRMFGVAAQTALATADTAGLCPLTPGASSFSDEAIWPLANAICAALSGEAAVSSALIDRARARGMARRIDLLLAEKVIGAGANGRRAVTIEWEGVDRLTAWRFGLATATGLAIPEPLFATVGPHVQAWRARAPMLPVQARLSPARVAAALGVFSNAALVDLYGAFADETDPAELSDTDAGRLRRAYVGEDDDARMAALRELWNDARGARDRYAAAILTARAAARVVPADAYESDAAALVGAMLSAGLDIQAARWAPVIEAMDDASADAGWAILAVGTPRPRVDMSYGRVSGFVDRAGGRGRHKAAMLVAALAGLGRISARDQARLAELVEIPLPAQDRWTRALDTAVARRQQGTVALLVAAGMQTPSWRAVPPHHFYRMVSALRRVGLDGEARMMAAEAMTRL